MSCQQFQENAERINQLSKNEVSEFVRDCDWYFAACRPDEVSAGTGILVARLWCCCISTVNQEYPRNYECCIPAWFVASNDFIFYTADVIFPGRNNLRVYFVFCHKSIVFSWFLYEMENGQGKSTFYTYNKYVRYFMHRSSSFRSAPRYFLVWLCSLSDLHFPAVIH